MNDLIIFDTLIGDMNFVFTRYPYVFIYIFIYCLRREKGMKREAR